MEHNNIKQAKIRVIRENRTFWCRARDLRPRLDWGANELQVPVIMVIFLPATTPVHVIVYFLYKDTGNKQNGNNFAVSTEKALKNNRSAGDFRSNDAHVTLLLIHWSQFNRYNQVAIPLSSGKCLGRSLVVENLCLRNMLETSHSHAMITQMY